MNISEQRADDLIVTLQALYGNLFIDSMKGLTLTQVKTVAIGIISTLTDDQYNRGMAQLNAKAGQGGYCPTIAEFKTWCMSGSWWTPQEAWQRACDYSNQSERELLDGKQKITTLTKKAWDSVYYMVQQGSMKEAFNQFKSIYETYLSKAQMQGRQQEWYVPPVMIGTKSKAMAAVEQKSMNPEHQRITELTAKFMRDGAKWGDAFKQAEFTVRGETKTHFRGVA